ncbi:MAG: LLM class F420-dependent oxidoreductase [Candidatus Tectimicrobiota bacterium]
MKPFRFGVTLGPASSRAAWVDKARQLEALGYGVLTVPDHLANFLAPLPALVSAAEATTHLRIGTHVLNNDFRHPVLLAREAATVDLLTQGRLQLGLGAGYMQAEYDEAGLRFETGARRVERLGETVRILKGLFTGAPVTFVGQHYQITRHQLQPLPVQRPHPPLLIGGNGPRLLTLAAQEADIVGLTGITFRPGGTGPELSGWTVAGLEKSLQHIRTAAGTRYDHLELQALVQRVEVTEHRYIAAEDLAHRWPQLGPADILQSPYVLLGTVEQIVEELQVRRERWGFSYYVIFERDMEAFAPVVARLAGR